MKKKVDELPKTYFENVPQNVFASAGQNVLLPCRVRHLNDKVVSALKYCYVPIIQVRVAITTIIRTSYSIRTKVSMTFSKALYNK